MTQKTVLTWCSQGCLRLSRDNRTDKLRVFVQAHLILAQEWKDLEVSRDILRGLSLDSLVKFSRDNLHEFRL